MKQPSEGFRKRITKLGDEYDMIFTDHAIERMWERHISFEKVLLVLDNPDRELEESERGKRYHRYVRAVGKQQRQVYVSCVNEGNKTVIISVGWRSKKKRRMPYKRTNSSPSKE